MKIICHHFCDFDIIWRNLKTDISCLLAFKDKKTTRGAYTESYRFCLNYPNFDLLTIDKVKEFNDIKSKYQRIFLVSQSINFYKKYQQVNLLFNTIQFTRPENLNKLCNPITNGFSTYKQSSDKYIGYFPMLYKPEYTINKIETNIPILGYYHRPQRDEFFSSFYNFIIKNTKDIKLYIMSAGNNILSSKPKNVVDIVYTNDPIKFWSNVTHYYYCTDNFNDPWPTTLQEAVNFNKQIVISEKGRNFRDGISDILEIIEYHTNINDTIYDNSNSILNTTDFNKIYDDPEGYLPKEQTLSGYLKKYK